MLCFNAGDMHRLTGPHRFYRFPCDDPHYNMKLRLGMGFIFDALLQLDKLKLLIPLSGKKRGKKSDNPSVLQHVLQNTLKEIIPTASATLAPIFATLCFNAGIFRTRFRLRGPFDFEPPGCPRSPAVFVRRPTHLLFTGDIDPWHVFRPLPRHAC